MTSFRSRVYAKFEAKRHQLEERAKKIQEDYPVLNCRLFAQLLTETPHIEKQPPLKKLGPGAILVWGNSSHVAVALDENRLIHVPEWHSPFEVIELKKMEQDLGKHYKIYRSNAM